MAGMRQWGFVTHDATHPLWRNAWPRRCRLLPGVGPGVTDRYRVSGRRIRCASSAFHCWG